jgi:hypothetical protein
MRLEFLSNALVFVTPTLGWTALALAIVWSFRDACAKSPPPALGWKWWLLLATVLLAFRWPMLWIRFELNPDESQLIAGALTLWHDPVFWRSLDGGTAGPLDYYPLMPAGLFSGLTAYAIARLTALTVVWGTLLFVGETLAAAANVAVARIALLPALAFYAFTTNPDFTHCSTELIPLLLLAAAACAIVRYTAEPSRSRLWFLAVLLGSVPFAKLQAAPIAAAFGAMLILHEIAAGRARGLAPLFIGALLPTLMIEAAGLIFGLNERIAVLYLFHNLSYAKSTPFSLGDIVGAQWWNSVNDGYFAGWLVGVAVFGLLALAYIGTASASLRRFGLAAVVLLAVAIACVLTPRRPFTHYLNLLSLPLSLIAGAAFGIVWQHASRASRLHRKAFWVGLFFVCTLLPQIVRRTSDDDRVLHVYSAYTARFTPELTEVIRPLATRGEPLAIWGRRCALYVETGLYQATRQAHSEAQILPGPWQRYFLQCYYEDFRAANPPVFVDAVGPGNFQFIDRSRAHEAFSPLRAWVQSHYSLVADIGGTRVYARNDRLAAGRTPSSTLPNKMAPPF